MSSYDDKDEKVQVLPIPPEEGVENGHYHQKHAVKTNFRAWFIILRSVSVEPAAMCMMTSTLMTYIVFQNLFIENICRVGRNHSALFCHDMVNVKVNSSFAKEEEYEIQKIFAQHKTYRSILDHTFPIIFVIFVGPWSDYYGRKVPLLVSSLGTSLYAFVTMICSFYVDIMDPLLLNLISGFPRIITGGEVAFGMAAYSFISDQTYHKHRTVRTGMLNAGYQLGIPLGITLAGLVTQHGFSYHIRFAISGMISLVGVVIILIAVKNETKTDRMKSTLTNFPIENYDMSISGGSEDNQPSCWTIVNPRNNFLQVIALPFKKRKSQARTKIWLLLLAFIFSAAPIHGEFQVMYLFVRERLGWDLPMYGNFSSYNWLIGVTGVALSMGILSKWLEIGDPVVGFISGMSQMGGCFIYLVANSSALMYLASTVDMMNGTMIVIARSMLSKLVHPDEIGKLFSLIAVLESFIPLGMNPIYTTVYIYTVETFSGSVIILSALLTIPPQLIYIWFILKGQMNREPMSTLTDEETTTFPMTKSN